MATSRRRLPNLVICGTPGTGKTSLASKLAEQAGFTHLDLSKYAVDNGLVDGWDEVLNCAVLDEDKVKAEFSVSSSYRRGITKSVWLSDLVSSWSLPVVIEFGCVWTDE